MSVLLLHENTSFDDQTVYATGHAYKGCVFTRCTIVMRGFPALFDRSTFIGCIWHLDFIIHDREQLGELRKMLDSAVIQSLPASPDETPAKDDGPPKD
jgi:hypothetical protein